jgi:hypothetical protein
VTEARVCAGDGEGEAVAAGAGLEPVVVEAAAVTVGGEARKEGGAGKKAGYCLMRRVSAMLLGCMAFIISCGSVVSQKNRFGPSTVDRFDADMRFS